MPLAVRKPKWKERSLS